MQPHYIQVPDFKQSHTLVGTCIQVLQFMSSKFNSGHPLHMYTCMFDCNYCRGVQFRWEFSRISEIRALTPALTNGMALTATATSAMRKNNIVPRDG